MSRVAGNKRGRDDDDDDDDGCDDDERDTVAGLPTCKIRGVSESKLRMLAEFAATSGQDWTAAKNAFLPKIESEYIGKVLVKVEQEVETKSERRDVLMRHHLMMTTKEYERLRKSAPHKFRYTRHGEPLSWDNLAGGLVVTDPLLIRAVVNGTDAHEGQEVTEVGNVPCFAAFLEAAAAAAKGASKPKRGIKKKGAEEEEEEGDDSDGEGDDSKEGTDTSSDDSEEEEEEEDEGDEESGEEEVQFGFLAKPVTMADLVLAQRALDKKSEKERKKRKKEKKKKKEKAPGAGSGAGIGTGKTPVIRGKRPAPGHGSGGGDASGGSDPE